MYYIERGNYPEPDVDDEQSSGGDDDEDGNDTRVAPTKMDDRLGRDLSHHDRDEDERQDDLFVVMKLPILIGTAWGLPPLFRFRENQKTTTVQCQIWFHVRTAISLLIIFFIGCNTLFIGRDFAKQFSCQKSIGDTIQKATGVWFYATGFFVYVFCLLSSTKSIEYCLYWRKISRKIQGTVISCPHLSRDMNLICLMILVSAVGENIFFHIYSMRTGNLLSQTDKRITFDQFLQDYFASNQYINSFFNYNPVIAVLLLVTNKCTLFAWNYGDVVIMMMCRAIYSRFVGLNNYLCLHLDSTGPVPVFKPGSVSWKTVRKNYLLIITLLDKADQIFYPLIWVSYTTNIVFVCNQLFMGIRNTSIKTAVHRTYVVWSLVHLCLRTFSLNVMASRINEHASKISKLLQFCAPEEYGRNVRMTDVIQKILK